MTLHIRAATPADAPALMALHGASWRAAYGPYVPPGALGTPLDANMRARWDRWPADRMIRLAERDGAVVGFGAVEWGNVPLLDNLHVSPDARGGGVGGRLFRAICADVATQGATALRLFVIEPHAGARRFYRRMGGVEGAAVDDMLLGAPVRMVPVLFEGAVFAALRQEL
ncbi:GNAT family N-acetyltransferase [uncultured Tateyamaria sp.]|uniref:GNAT family N-acetyltransferase n=1 Tax=Tateyamaria sp. 1078 TaxID=3417464 RepID=UPI002613CCC3|nr:GNAT family N-acetyltransferase [uncultured Tateyamaria sp.]